MAREFEVGPELFKMPRGEGMMRKPHISRRPDLYLSPVEVESAGAPADSVVWLARGQAVAVLELSTKPLVDLVWIGALLALLGAAIAGIRRAMEVTAGRKVAGRPVAAPAR